MSNSRNLSRRGRSARALQAAVAASAFAVPLIWVAPVHAATTTLYWDLNGSTAGAGGGTQPSGTWDVGTTPNWNTASAGTAAAASTWVNGDNADFSAGTSATGSYTVTVASGGVSVNQLFVEEASTIMFTGGPITITFPGGNFAGGANIEPGAGSTANTLIFNNAIAAASNVPVALLRNTAGDNVTFNSTNDSFSGGLFIGLNITLTTGAAGVIPTSNVVSMSGNLNLNNTSLTVKGLAASGGSANLTLGTATITIDGGSTSSFFLGNDIIGSGGITLVSGTQAFSTNYASWTGPTTINGGIFQVDSLNNAGTTSSLGASTIANPAGNLVLNGGTLDWFGGVNVSTNRNYTFQSSSAFGADGTAACTFTGAMTASNTSPATLTLNGSSLSNLVNGLNGKITDGPGGAISVVKNGSNTWSLGSSANNYSGSTTVNGGTLALGANNAVPSGSALTINSGATFGMSGNSATVAAVHLLGGAITGGAGSTLTSTTDFDVQGGNVTANLAGSVGLNKTTSGTSTITGNQTYTGDTTVQAGALFLNGGTTSTGTIHALSGAKVGGTSTFQGPVVIDSGAHFVAGNAHGDNTASTLGSGSIDFKAGANLDFTLGANANPFGSSNYIDAGSGFNNLNFEGTTAAPLVVNLFPTESGNFHLIFYNSYQGSFIIHDTPNPLTDTVKIGSIGAATSATLADNGGEIDATVMDAPDMWNNSAGGDWATAANWDTGIVPNIQGAAAILSNALLTDQSVTLNTADATVGVLKFDNTNHARYTISSTTGHVLIMDSTGGAAILDSNGSHTINVGVKLNTDTTVTVTHSGDSLTFGGALTGTGAITTTGAGNVSFSSTVLNSVGITNSGSGSLTLSNVVSGSGGIVNSGSGTTFLSTTNTYTGKVVVSSGMISVTGDGGLGAAPGAATPDSVTIGSGATLQFTDNTTVNANRGIKIVQDGTGTIDVASGNKAVTYAGTISATGSGTNTTLGKSGAGVFNYTGATTGSPAYNKLLITGGTFDSTFVAALPPAPTLTADWCTLNGGTLQILGQVGLFSTNRGFTLGANGGGLASGPGVTNTFPGVIAGSTSGRLTISGAGILGLGGANTYTGGTILNATGTLLIANNSALGTGTLSLQQGTIQSDTTTARALSVPVSVDGNVTIGGTGAMTFSGPITLTGNRILTVSNTAATTFSGIIGETGGSQSMTKLGAGLLALTSANTYTGGTTIGGGTVALGNDAALSSGNVTISAASTVESNGAARNIANNFVLNGGGVTFNGVAADALTIAGVISESAGSFTVTKLGAGSLTLTGTNTYSGGTTFTGATSGTIFLANDSALGTGTVTIGGNGVTLSGNGSPRTIANNFVESGGGMTFAGTLADNLTITGSWQITAGRNWIVNSAGATTMAGAITDVAPGFAVTKRGTGVLTLTGNNTQTGYTQGNGTDGGTTTVLAGSLMGPTGTLNMVFGTLNLNNTAQTIGNLTGAGGSLVLGTGNTLTINATANNTTATPITGPGSLAYNASAAGVTETLTSTGNGFTGSTSVTGGTLKLQGNLLTTSSVSVDNTSNHGAILQLATGGGQNFVLKTPTVSATNNGKIDLQDNKMIVTVTPLGSLTGSAYGGVQGLVQSGFNNGGWNGAGLITSQTSAAGLNALTTLAVATAGDINYGGTVTFAGQTVNTTDTLVMYTYNGDMNLNGTINGDDYARIDAGFASHGAMTGYENGDLNYDGKINADDYFIIDKNYGHASDLGTFPHAPGLDGLAGVSAVPEPTSLALLALAAGTLGRRRRRSQVDDRMIRRTRVAGDHVD